METTQRGGVEKARGFVVSRRHRTFAAVGIILIAATGLTVTGNGVASAGDDGQVCTGLDSGKIDTTGDPLSVTVTAPAGYLIDGYCVKAGSVQQGNGPEYVSVSPPSASVTITHSTGKAVSHYSYSLTPKSTTTTSTTSTTTTTTEPEDTTTTSSTTTTTEPEDTTTTSSTTTTTTEPKGTTTTSSTTTTSTSTTSSTTTTSSVAVLPPESTTTVAAGTGGSSTTGPGVASKPPVPSPPTTGLPETGRPVTDKLMLGMLVLGFGVLLSAVARRRA
jgi:hypothetical protein